LPLDTRWLFPMPDCSNYDYSLPNCFSNETGETELNEETIEELRRIVGIAYYKRGEQWYVRVGNTSYKLSVDDLKALQGLGPETEQMRLVKQVAKNRLDNLMIKAESKYKGR